MDDLTNDFDVIVIGTGMTESILASALSRIGKTVLHLDSNEYYGENWASFSFEGIQKWIKRMKSQTGESIEKEEEKGHEREQHQQQQQAENENEKVEDGDGEKESRHGRDEENAENMKENEIFHKIEPKCYVSNVKEKWWCKKNCETNCESPPIGENEKEIDAKETERVDSEENKQMYFDYESYFRQESRRFNLDLCSKVLFSRGPLVELLISSNIAKYAEFKSITRVLTRRKDRLELVPCSRADVFSTRNITVVEKRLLVKILTSFLKYPENSEEFNGFENKTFYDYLKHKKLPNNILHYVLYAIAMGNKSMPCLDGVKASKVFLESLGRYGNTPFIFPMYGLGELPQCFCRLCAVYGGVYYLKRGIEGIVANEDKCVALVSEKKRLDTRTVIMSSNYMLPCAKVKGEKRKISRGIFITDRSILESEKEPLTLLLFPPDSGVLENVVTVVELSPGTNTCPEKVFVVHMTTVAKTDAESDLEHVADALFQTRDAERNESATKPKVIWSLTWNVTQQAYAVDGLENVKVCSGPAAELDFNDSIDEAKRLFEELCPGSPFLPRAPDPEEITLEIKDSENEQEPSTTVGESGEGPDNGVALNQADEECEPQPDSSGENVPEL